MSETKRDLQTYGTGRHCNKCGMKIYVNVINGGEPIYWCGCEAPPSENRAVPLTPETKEP